MKSSEITSLPSFSKWVSVISTQAELRAAAWSNRHAWGISDVSLRKLRNHRKRVEENMSRLCAWVGRTRPKGEALYVSRYIYSQYKKELEIVDSSIERLSKILDKGGS